MVWCTRGVQCEGSSSGVTMQKQHGGVAHIKNITGKINIMCKCGVRFESGEKEHSAQDLLA